MQHERGVPVGTAVKLTARQIDVLALSAADNSSKETARLLFLSTETVKTHRRRAMETLGCGTWPGAVAKAIREGLLPQREADK